jgi:S1-C subfamily serine protease
VIPPLRRLSRTGNAPIAHWLGAEIRDVEGEEYSAFGLTRDAGGVVILDAPGNSNAVRSGLRTGDVVMGIGNQRVKTVDDLARLISLAPLPIELGIRRDQTDQIVRLTTSVSAPTR